MMWRIAFILLSFQCFAQPFTKDQLLGKVTPATDTSFAQIGTYPGSARALYLRVEAAAALQRMIAAAKADSIELTVLSATRTFEHQAVIWNRKYKAAEGTAQERVEQVLEYSAMPGTSRHHWGTEVDFNSLSTDYFKAGVGKAVHDWLSLHAAAYGFYQCYTDSVEGSYETEPWHWSYLPLSGPMLKAYSATVTYDDLVGFHGCHLAEDLAVFERFVWGIDPKLLQL